MRGVMIMFIVVFALVAMIFLAPPAIEGVGEEVKDHLPDTTIGDRGEGVIDDLYTSIFVYVPVILIFGFGVWGIAWYIRRQVTIRRF